LKNICGPEPSTLADSPDTADPPDLGEPKQRVFDAAMTPDEAETGISFFITKAQKAGLRRLGYTRNRSVR